MTYLFRVNQASIFRVNTVNSKFFEYPLFAWLHWLHFHDFYDTALVLPVCLLRADCSDTALVHPVCLLQLSFQILCETLTQTPHMTLTMAALIVVPFLNQTLTFWCIFTDYSPLFVRFWLSASEEDAAVYHEHSR
jgi:hypothetical protein